MKQPFDIFWFRENGPKWIEAVETLETAKKHIEKLPLGNSGGYAVLAPSQVPRNLSDYVHFSVSPRKVNG
jgi:hypothetical protein